MRVNRSAIVLPALLALVVLTAGCSMPGMDGGSGDGATATVENETNVENGADAETPDDAQSIQSRAISTMQDVRSLRMSVTMNMTAGGQELSQQADAVVDMADRRMRMTTESPYGSSTAYVIEDTMYVETNGQWQTQSVGATNYWNNTNVARQQEFLSVSNVTTDGTDTVDGERVHGLRIEPNQTVLRDLFQNSQGANSVPLENIEFSDVSMVQYVDAESYHVRRTHVSMTVSTQGETASMDMTMAFSDFEGDFDIELPADAPTG